MKNYEINLDKLDSLSIFQLREVGAKVGVKSPTSLRTKELKKAIIDVVTGVVEPYIKEKSGRPHKSIIPDEKWDEIIGFNRKFNAFDDQPTTMPLYNPRSSMNKRFSEQVLSGFVIESFHDLIFVLGEPDDLKVDKFAYITHSTQYGGLVNSGDKIECNIFFDEYNNNTPTVKKILSINGQDTSQFASTYKKSSPIIVGEIINFTLPQLQFINTKCPLHKGQRLFINGQKHSGQTYLANSIAKELQEQYSIIYVSMSKEPTEKMNFDKVEYFFTTFDANPTDVIFNFDIAFARAKNLCNNGHQVIFIVDDLATLIKNYIFAFQKKYSCPAKHYDDILNNLKALCASTKATSYGSFTAILTATDEELPQQLSHYLDVINSICNCHISLDKDSFLNNNLEFFIPEKTYSNEKQRSNLV